MKHLLLFLVVAAVGALAYTVPEEDTGLGLQEDTVSEADLDPEMIKYEEMIHAQMQQTEDHLLENYYKALHPGSEMKAKKASACCITCFLGIGGSCCCSQLFPSCRCRCGWIARPICG